ncbi:binuclear zinc transcription factor [Diaporthe sp. PMI_573]|nr:binuclear zinc transcription factor [Diaporthaceae sp. PMI_573]
MPSTPFSCRPCRSRKMKCDRVQPRCGRCTRLGDTCEYPKKRRANVGRRKRVVELETKVDQLEQLARATKNGPEAERIQSQQASLQDSDAFLYTNDLDTTQFSGASSHDKPQPDTSFTDLISVGLFEQQPAAELALFLTNVYFDKWHWAAPMFHRARYIMSLHLPPQMRPPMCLYYIILALGSDITKSHRRLAMPFYQRARTYAQSDEMRHSVTVAHAQAWSLIANFEAQQLRFAHASMSLGKAIGIAQMLGLHLIDATTSLSRCQEWARVEEMRRTWWVIYCSDRLVCGSTGWPAIINDEDTETHLPASEEAFQTGSEEHTSPLTSMVHLEGRNISAFASRVLATSHFYQAFQHSARTPSANDTWDLQTSLHWKTHREIDNDLAMLLHCLPEDVKLPESIRCQNATFVNIIIHTSVICLHRAAISTMRKFGILENMVCQSRSRLIAAAEEILNILRMMPDVNDMLKNPMLAFSMYLASLVFLDQMGLDEPDYQCQGNLDFTLRFMILAAKTWGNPVTRSMAIQLAVEMRQKGLDSLVVEKATELPLERSTLPILAKGGDDSPNVLFQVRGNSSKDMAGTTTDYPSTYDPGSQ